MSKKLLNKFSKNIFRKNYLNFFQNSILVSEEEKTIFSLQLKLITIALIYQVSLEKCTKGNNFPRRPIFRLFPSRVVKYLWPRIFRSLFGLLLDQPCFENCQNASWIHVSFFEKWEKKKIRKEQVYSQRCWLEKIQVVFSRNSGKDLIDILAQLKWASWALTELQLSSANLQLWRASWASWAEKF